MIPIGHQPTKQKIIPVIVYLLVIINIYVFLLEILLGEPFIVGYSAIPYEITNNVDLVKPGFIDGLGKIPQAPGPDPIYLTLLTSMFMHGSLLHIVGNMIYLWVFGEEIEGCFGHFRLLIFYLLCGIIASLAHIVNQPLAIIPSLGASGAIAGILGAYLVTFPTHKIKVIIPVGIFASIVELPAIFIVGFWFILQLLGQFSTAISSSGDGVAYMAHIGGFLAGIFFSRFFYRNEVLTIDEYSAKYPY